MGLFSRKSSEKKSSTPVGSPVPTATISSPSLSSSPKIASKFSFGRKRTSISQVEKRAGNLVSEKEGKESVDSEDPILKFIEGEKEEFVYDGLLVMKRSEDAGEGSAEATEEVTPNTSSVKYRNNVEEEEDDEENELERVFDEEDEQEGKQKLTASEVINQYKFVLTRCTFYKLQTQKKNRFKSIGIADENGCYSTSAVDEFVEAVGVPLRPVVFWKLPLTYVLRVEPSKEDNRIFNVFSYKKNKTKSLAARVICRSLKCDTKRERDSWVALFNRVKHEFWKLMFESRTIPEPEVYRGHVFVGKINTKGKEQKRCIVLSDKRIFLVKLPPGEDAKKGTIKWILPLSVIEILRTYELTPTAFGFVMDKEGATKALKGIKKLHQQIVFNCTDTMEMSNFIREIRKSYLLVEKKELDIEMLDCEAERSKN